MVYCLDYILSITRDGTRLLCDGVECYEMTTMKNITSNILEYLITHLSKSSQRFAWGDNRTRDVWIIDWKPIFYAEISREVINTNK